MRCSKCDRRSVYLRRYSGQRFCGEHFLRYFKSKVEKKIKKERMVKKDGRVGVAFSGGKDSITTLYILHSLQKKFNLSISAVAVDEGIGGYREKTLIVAKRFCEEYNTPLYIEKFEERFGTTLDDIMKKNINACSYCGVLRRRLLNDKAKELKLDCLATGHNLDDEVQAILMNYIRGDIGRLVRLDSSGSKGGFIRRIKPLAEMPEKEVALYTFLQDSNIKFNECPYSFETFRSGIRDFINELENKNPGIKFSILQGYRKLMPYMRKYSDKAIVQCSRCNEPSSQKVCKVCSLLSEIYRENYIS